MKKNIFISLILLLLSPICFAGEAKTATALKASDFCKEFKCAVSSPFKDEDGNTNLSFRILKDPTRWDMYVIVDGDSLKKVIFKFVSEEATADKKIVSSLLSTISAKSVDTADLDKVVTAADTKTTRAQLASSERISVGAVKVAAGKILRKPTIQIELQ